MPRFDQPRLQTGRRILYYGHSGSGKTGSLVSLAASGLEIEIVDLDDGSEVIDDLVTNKEKSIYLRAHPGGLWTAEQAASIADRIHYVKITESYNIQGTRAIPRGDSWGRVQAQLNDWRDGDRHLGNIGKWPANKVLVIDGLSRLCESAMNFQLAMNGRLLQGPQVGRTGDNDYTAAYRMILAFLDMLKSADIKCNIIVICHIRSITEERQGVRDTKGFPQTIGPMLAPQVPQYFNHAIRAKTVGNRRVIETNTTDDVELKTVAPLRLKPTYDLATGLAEYFRDLSTIQYVQPEQPKPEPTAEAAQ